MNWWEKMDFHLENFIPGLATIWILKMLFRLQFNTYRRFENNDVINTAFWIAAAYLLGVIVNIAGRLLFDYTSERFSRPIIFRRFAKGKLGGVKNASIDQVNYAYNRYVTYAIQEAKETSREVAKRRQSGRLIRSALIPIVLATIYYSNLNRVSPFITFALITFEVFTLLVLYGYAEVTILHEAYHSVPKDMRSIEAIEKERNI